MAMKQLSAIFITVLALYAMAGAAIWPNSPANHGINTACTTGTSTCVVSLPLKVGAGDLLHFAIFLGTTANASCAGGTDAGCLIASITGDAGTFADLASSAGATAGNVNCGYILNAAGGEISVTINTNFAIVGAWKASVIDIPVSGSTFDVSANIVKTSSTSQTGVALSPTSRADIIIRCTRGGATTIQLATRGYTVADVNGGSSCWTLSNTFNGTAPTYTLSLATTMVEQAEAFTAPLSPASLIN